MSDLRTAAQQALEAMESDPVALNAINNACAVLRAALAQQAEPEPVAWSFEARHIDTAWGLAVSLKHPGQEHKYLRNVKPLYTAPPQRKPLTAQQIDGVIERHVGGSEITDAMYTSMEQFARAVEQASWEKNHG